MVSLQIHSIPHHSFDHIIIPLAGFQLAKAATFAIEMPTSPIQNDLEKIVARQQAELKQRPASPPRRQKQEAEEPVGATKAQPLMRPPPVQPNMLNEQMAKEAAKTYKKKEKRIRAACAAVDAGEPLPPPKQQACCVIL